MALFYCQVIFYDKWNFNSSEEVSSIFDNKDLIYIVNLSYASLVSDRTKYLKRGKVFFREHKSLYVRQIDLIFTHVSHTEIRSVN